MSDADRIAGIVNEWFQTLPTPAMQQRDRSRLIGELSAVYAQAKNDFYASNRRIASLEGELERAALTERVRIVAEVRAFADQVRREGLTGPITAGIIDQAADRINVLPRPAHDPSQPTPPFPLADSEAVLLDGRPATVYALPDPESDPTQSDYLWTFAVDMGTWNDLVSLTQDEVAARVRKP